ncbi:dnaJ homolog subfamily C member 8-like [Anneissia japonica]|uniref:dnaJ homolog subfamily C member 8-like n=1 Tax=Anneissia japonica TaxID=1529436 RepID=UPI0014257F93|nr:dnaJ homolog subfamily C member 8-like [Anneissia japonica]
MAASSKATSGQPTGAESVFSSFMTEVKEIEKKDSVLTSKQQIDRLLRPGSTYFNLNPFEVLQVEPDMKVEIIKKQYRKLSILIHPDKNPDNKDRALSAFEIINKAMKTIEDENHRKRVLNTIQEAKEKTEFEIEEKRKKLKKEGKPTSIEEDDPERLKATLYKTTVKLFADYERRRKELEDREQQIRKREREEEIANEDKTKKQKEWQKEWEDGRTKRVDNWRNFNDKKKKKKSSNKGQFRPPKPKLEQR